MVNRGSGRRTDKEWTCINRLTGQLAAANTLAGNGAAFQQRVTILRARGYVQAAFDATV